MGQQKDRQGDLMVGWSEMPRSPGHVFYDRLQSVLVEADFVSMAEQNQSKGRSKISPLDVMPYAVFGGCPGSP